MPHAARGLCTFAAFCLALATGARAQSFPTFSVYNFKGYTGTASSDGALPFGGTLVDRNNPNIVYGTTTQGGEYNGGAIYQMTFNPGALPTDKIIYSFKADPDLGAPTGRLYQDASGALYGGTIAGSKVNNGGIFKLTPPANGTGAWTETILYTFPAAQIIGANFNVSGLVGDGHGHLFGTIFAGRGHVFEINETGHYRSIHDFQGPDGQGPMGPVTIGPDGKLYGSTGYGGQSPCSGFGCGVIFSLARSGPTWNFAELYSFDGGAGGSLTIGHLALDAAGNIYGTNNTIGNHPDGTAFRIAPATPSAPATETVLATFTHEQPVDGIALDAAGNAYGTAQKGYREQIEYVLPATPGGQYGAPITLAALKNNASNETDGLTVTSSSTVVTIDGLVDEAISNQAGNGSVFRISLTKQP